MYLWYCITKISRFTIRTLCFELWIFSWISDIDIVLFVRLVSHNTIDKTIYHFLYWKVSLLSQYLFSQFVMHKYLPCYIWSHVLLQHVFFHNMWWGNYFERLKEEGDVFIFHVTRIICFCDPKSYKLFYLFWIHSLIYH